MNRIKVYARNVPWEDSIHLLITETDFEGKRTHLAKSIEMAPIELHAPTTPTCSLSRESSQLLMDQLWECGLRPSEGTGSAGAMAAVEKHLGDMRKLVSKYSGVTF
jgi:hypothetical protein